MLSEKNLEVCASEATKKKIYLTFNAMNNADILKEWNYRGEGNANIVISLPKTRQILRIHKTLKRKTYFEQCMDSVIQYLKIKSGHSTKKEGLFRKNIGNKFKLILENIFEWCFYFFDIEYKKEIYAETSGLQFYEQVMVPLLGRNFTSDATSIYLSKREITRLEEEIETFRPEFRKNKRMLYGRATLFADYAYLPKSLECLVQTTGLTYAIEIKPKQGWINSSSTMSKMCKFCKNQYLKLENGQIQQISTYCPLDLFSGKKERMLRALKSLVAHPQNNFRIFCNGNYAFGEKTPSKQFHLILQEMFESTATQTELENVFFDLLHTALTKPSIIEGCDHFCELEQETLLNKSENETREIDSSGGCFYEESLLPKGCVLEKILNVQKLDRLNLSRYEAIYKKLKQRRNLDDWKYVNDLLDEINHSKCSKCVILKYINNSERSTTNELDLIPYLIASIARDCSFMITFKKIERTNSKTCCIVINTKFGEFLVNVGIFDLYPKPLSTIPKHVNRDIKINKAYSVLNKI